jgi:hypothetical protein
VDGSAPAGGLGPLVAGRTPVARTAASRRSAGETCRPRCIHEVLATRRVLEIDNFNLWYGSVQALFDITMPVPRARSPR